MTRQAKTATVFGGTGFLGRYVVQALAQDGYMVRVASRNPKKAYFLKPYGFPGQISGEYVNHRDKASLGKALEGSDIAINLIGILHENRKQKFHRLHALLPEAIAEAVRDMDLDQFIHISALGIDKSNSRYAKSKLDGEDMARAVLPTATILRPGLLFGKEDDFFNRFASMAQIAPALPLIGGGKTRFQPVYVCDVARAVVNALKPENKALGQTYELAGPDIFSFKELMQKMLHYSGQKAALISLPWPLARLMAAGFSILPGKPALTQDQIDSLHQDNILYGAYPGLGQLGTDTTPLDLVLPTYLARYKNTSKFSLNRDKKPA